MQAVRMRKRRVADISTRPFFSTSMSFSRSSEGEEGDEDEDEGKGE